MKAVPYLVLAICSWWTLVGSIGVLVSFAKDASVHISFSYVVIPRIAYTKEPGPRWSIGPPPAAGAPR